MLGLDVIIFQFNNDISNIDDILPLIADNHNILDYICINGFTYVISDGASLPKSDSLHSNFSFVISVSIFTILLICMIFLTAVNTHPLHVKESDSTVSTNDNDILDTPILESDSTNEYQYDSSKYYRIVMYPLNELSEEDFTSDFSIIKGRFDALCGDSEYELKQIDNHICAFIPIDSVDGPNSLNYLCKYYISNRFEISSLDIYKDDNNSRRYRLSSLESDAFKDISLRYGKPNEDFLKLYNSYIATNGEQFLPDINNLPYVNIEYSNSLMHRMSILHQEKDYSFSNLGITINGDEFRDFILTEISDNNSVIFPTTIYAFSDNIYIENALRLLLADFKLGPLCSDYAYSITTNNILWDTDFTGSNQCSIENFEDDFCYIDYSTNNNLLSAGQFLDFKKYICHVMDSLQIPYALGHKDSIPDNSTHIYIACGYKNMGIPIANMISEFSTSYNHLYLYDGFYKLPLTYYNIDSTNDSISLYLSNENTNFIEDYIKHSKSEGHNELYLSINDTLLVKADLSLQNSFDCITFDKLVYNCEDATCEWNFIKSLLDAPDSSQFIKFNGFELITLDKNMIQLANQFTIKPFCLDSNTVDLIKSVASDVSISYGETYNGNLYNVSSGKIYINLNLNVDESFPTKSSELVKEITKLCNINHNPQIDLITYTLTNESFEDLEKSKISIFRHYIPLENDFSLGELSSNDSFEELLSESKKEMGRKIPVDYADYYLINYSKDDAMQADAGIYSAGLLLGERMNSYKEMFHDIIVNDTWFNYSDVFESLWIYDYDFPYKTLD